MKARTRIEQWAHGDRDAGWGRRVYTECRSEGGQYHGRTELGSDDSGIGSCHGSDRSYRHSRQPPGALAVRVGGRSATGPPPRSDRRAVEIKTHGDRDRNTPLAAIGGVGLFTKEIQRAVLDGSVDIAVHSLKDLPTQGPAELVLAAVPPREDVADALISPTHRTLDALPPGAKVGTSSPRRRAQLLFRRPDLEVVTIRGNVETRLNQALEGRLDAVVLAWAGLKRLGLESHVTQRLAPPEFLPAVGQGALGIECRREDAAVLAFLATARRPGHPSRRDGRACRAGGAGRRLHHPYGRLGPGCRGG